MDHKIAEMAGGISHSVGKTLLEMTPQLKAKYRADGAQLASAIIAAHIMLLAGAVAGVVCGPDASDTARSELSGEMVVRIQLVIKAVTEGREKPDA
jgi:hypothetical protein